MRRDVHTCTHSQACRHAHTYTRMYTLPTLMHIPHTCTHYTHAHTAHVHVQTHVHTTHMYTHTHHT
jgi:hypothetical protein